MILMSRISIIHVKLMLPRPSSTSLGGRYFLPYNEEIQITNIVVIFSILLALLTKSRLLFLPNDLARAGKSAPASRSVSAYAYSIAYQSTPLRYFRSELSCELQSKISNPLQLHTGSLYSESPD